MERYNKLNMIGKGTFGSVWLVESKSSGNKYALKELSVRTMSDTDRHLALNEVKILSKLKHKNIIRYKDAIHHGLSFYIVMEYAEGGDLYTKIKQSKGLFMQEQILDWFTQLLLALKHIHGFNILHRDLKTQNIFLTKSNVVKLGDFGIARILDSTTDHAQTTVGTPYYLSPEICQQQPYNQKSDMWALGCVMYEITALIPPFTADCFSSLVVKILHGKYTPIPRVFGPLLQDLIDILLRANPQDRPTAKQLLYAPAMKPYVEKFAVIQRDRMNSIASNIGQPRNPVKNQKPKKIPQPKDTQHTQETSTNRKQEIASQEDISEYKSSKESLEANQPITQVLDKNLMKHQNANNITQEGNGVSLVKESRLPIEHHRPNQPALQVTDKKTYAKHQNAERIVKVAKPPSTTENTLHTEKSVTRSVRENEEPSASSRSNKISVEITIHQEPKQAKILQSQVGTKQSKASADNARQHNAVSTPLDAAAAEHIRQSILMEHVKRRRRSAVCSTACDGSGSGLIRHQRKKESIRKHTRIQSESAAQFTHQPVLKEKRLGTYKISADNDPEPGNDSADRGLEISKSGIENKLTPNHFSADKYLFPSRINEQLVSNKICTDRGMVSSQNQTDVLLLPSAHKGVEPSEGENSERSVTNKHSTNEQLRYQCINDKGLSPRNDAAEMVPHVIRRHQEKCMQPNNNNMDQDTENGSVTLIDRGLVSNNKIDGVRLVPRNRNDNSGLKMSKGDNGLEPKKSNDDNGLGSTDYKTPRIAQSNSDQGAIPKVKQKSSSQVDITADKRPGKHSTRRIMSKNDEQFSSSKNTNRQRMQCKVQQANAVSKDHRKPSGTTTIAQPPDELNNKPHQELDIQAENCSKTININIQRTLAALKHKQALNNARKMVDDEEGSCRSRDRAVSVPGVRQARARRQAARESLEQHMHYCRRARRNSKRTLSRERLDKENICPMVKDESGQFKGVTKRKSNVKPPQRLDVMVETPSAFKRCETYRVAQFRRLPLMSVPDVTNCAESNTENVLKSQQNKSRHKSETSVHPKLTFSKFKGIRGVQIDKARRRAKKIATNFGVESSRSEFSKKPDEATVEKQKSPKMYLKKDKRTDQTSVETEENSTEPADNEKLKFNFRGKTLHLNATDAKSTFARIEALRVFLEENLGTERFIEAYQHLNGSSLFGNKNDVAKDDGGLESILGKYNIDYLPLLKQLIVSEANHFGTSV